MAAAHPVRSVPRQSCRAMALSEMLEFCHNLLDSASQSGPKVIGIPRQAIINGLVRTVSKVGVTAAWTTEYSPNFLPTIHRAGHLGAGNRRLTLVIRDRVQARVRSLAEWFGGCHRQRALAREVEEIPNIDLEQPQEQKVMDRVGCAIPSSEATEPVLVAAQRATSRFRNSSE